MIQQSLYQSAELRQEQVIAPHQIQSLEMLTAPYLEMQALINQEIELNPTLERLDTKGEQLIGDPMEDASAPASNNDESAGIAAEKDEFLANLMQLDDSWKDYLPPSHAKAYSSSDEEKRKYFFDSLVAKTSLSDHLMEQMRTNDCTTRLREIGEAVIGSISESGYLRTKVEDIAIICNASKDDVLEVLRLIQSFDPPGVGARDLRECLILQLQRAGKKNTLAYKVVDKYLEKLGKNRIPEIAKGLGISPAALYDVIYEIRQLKPKPGNVIESSAEHYVVPEVFIKKDGNNGLVVTTNKDNTPTLRVSTRYLKLLEDPNTPDDVKAYIKEKVTNSNLLIKSLSQRQSTIHRIAERIVAHQRDFFENGDESMKPLTMGRVADEIGVHETTVSRATSNKYVQSPQGIFPFKHFFTSGFETDAGDALSSVSIRKKIQAIISEEDPSRPISDQKIVKLLTDSGLTVARRTVAKYREALGIPSSHRRKNYGGL